MNFLGYLIGGSLFFVVDLISDKYCQNHYAKKCNYNCSKCKNWKCQKNICDKERSKQK